MLLVQTIADAILIPFVVFNILWPYRTMATLRGAFAYPKDFGHCWYITNFFGSILDVLATSGCAVALCIPTTSYATVRLIFRFFGMKHFASVPDEDSSGWESNDEFWLGAITLFFIAITEVVTLFMGTIALCSIVRTLQAIDVIRKNSSKKQFDVPGAGA